MHMIVFDLYIWCFFFFFSSRRRHTRFDCDWSSDVCSSDLPQDAVRSIRVITNSYDVARGQFSGGLVASTTRGGTNVPQGAFTYALRDRSLEWGEVTSSPFGQGMTQNQLGGGMGGPIVPNKLFVFAALQGRWRGQLLPSL